MKILLTAALAALLLSSCASKSSTTPAPVVTVTTLVLPSATTGVQYSQQLTGTGGTTPYSWRVVSGTLPAGITLSVSGMLSGKPTGVGQYTFVVQLTDSALAQASVTVSLRENS